MKTLTVRQPHASLLVTPDSVNEGRAVKWIETRPYPPGGSDWAHLGASRRLPAWAVGRGERIEIRAAATRAPGWSLRDLWHDPDRDTEARYRCDLLVDHLGCEPVEDVNSGWYWTVDSRNLPLGAVVGSARVADVLPIVGALAPVEGCPTRGVVEWREHSPGRGLWLWEPGEMVRNISPQLPLGDFTPGRWAWLFDQPERITDPEPCKGRQGVWSR